jgi:alpha-tubulin suppressor-like RCC1 family protein
MIKSLEKKFITKIDCGDFHSLALDDHGTLYSWGISEKGECGNGKFEDVETPSRIKFFDGKIIVDVVAGNHHTLALTT